jgi:hypothetical protein
MGKAIHHRLLYNRNYLPLHAHVPVLSISVTAVQNLKANIASEVDT